VRRGGGQQLLGGALVAPGFVELEVAVSA
jgi:hypothetical protein